MTRSIHPSITGCAEQFSTGGAKRSSKMMILSRTSRTRAGLYHWLELEFAGRDLGGDFDYTRLLADVRSLVRLSPATTLALRLVGGSNFDGRLPAQRTFTVGGVVSPVEPPPVSPKNWAW